MLLHIVAVSLVVMVCESEGLKATFDCIATEEEVMNCLKKPEQKQSLTQFHTRWVNQNMRGVTALLKQLKNDGCISASEWTNIQAWIKVSTPPKAFISIMKNLTKAQRTTFAQYLINNSENVWNEQLEKKAEAINEVINEKINDLSGTDKEKFDEWKKKYMNTCVYNNSDS